MSKSMLARFMNAVMVVVLLPLAACAPAVEPARDPTAIPEVAAATVLPAAPPAVSATPTVLPTALAPATLVVTPTATPNWSRLLGDELTRRGPDGANQALSELTAWAREASGIRDQLGAEADDIFRLFDGAHAALAQELIRQLEAGHKPPGLPALVPPRSGSPARPGQFAGQAWVGVTLQSLITQVRKVPGTSGEPYVITNEADSPLVPGVNGHTEVNATLTGSQLQAKVKIALVMDKDGKRYEEKASGTLEGDICPDEQGRVPLNLTMEISYDLRDGGAATLAFAVEAVGQVDDEANLVTLEQEIRAETSVRQVNTWPFGAESIRRGQLGVRIESNGLITDKGSTWKVTDVNWPNDVDPVLGKLVIGLAGLWMNQAFDTARQEWQSGCCVEIVIADDLLGYLVGGAGADSSFTAIVRHRFEGKDLKAPVAAAVDSGGGSVTPANTKVLAPAAFVYTAPDEAGEAQIKLVSRSRRGVAELKVRVKIWPNYYRVESSIGLYSQVPLRGRVCYLELPFTLIVEGQNPSGGKYEGVIRFTPTGGDSGTWVHTATSEVHGHAGTVSGSGTYRLEGVAEGKPVLRMAATTAKSEVEGYAVEYDWPAWQIELIPDSGGCIQTN